MPEDRTPIVPSKAVVEAVLEEARAEGFTDMTSGGAYRLAYVALNTACRLCKDTGIGVRMLIGPPTGQEVTYFCSCPRGRVLAAAASTNGGPAHA